MLKKHTLFLLLFFFLGKINAQNKTHKTYKATLDTAFEMGSKIESIALNNEQIKNLALLGKIWGFLKYHHPKVAQGEYNWDFELFRVMPKILKTKDKSARDKVLIQWIDSLGIVAPNKAPICEVTPDAKQKPDYAWMNSKNMAQKLVAKLLFIQKNRNIGKHYNVVVNDTGAPPYFINEEDYIYIYNYPDVGFRLLSLYRFWNIIQYYYPYKYALTEEAWDTVLEKLIPTFIEAQNARDYRTALLSMLHAAHDSHIVLYKDSLGRESKFKPIIKIRFIEDNAVVTEIMDKTSFLKLGDVILEKNGEKIENIVQKMLPFTPASNQTTQLRKIRDELLGTNDKSVKLKILRDDALLEIVEPTNRYVRDIPFVQNSNNRLLSKEVGYINLGTATESQLDSLFEQFKTTKGIILDLRNYPELNMEEFWRFGELLMPHSIPYATFSNTSLNCPGLFHTDVTQNIGKERTDYYKGKLLILVNEATQSKAELFVMGLRKAPKAIVMGSQTAGADGPVVEFPLVGGYSTGISGRGVYYPDGKETQRIGIIPDIEVKPTIKGIKEGKDEMLDKAIEYILKN